MVELLRPAASIPVSEASDRTLLEPDHFYVCPSKANIALENGVIRLVPLTDAQKGHMSIDAFFYSLARRRQQRADSTIGMRRQSRRASGHAPALNWGNGSHATGVWRVICVLDAGGGQHLLQAFPTIIGEYGRQAWCVVIRSNWTDSGGAPEKMMTSAPPASRRPRRDPSRAPAGSTMAAADDVTDGVDGVFRRLCRRP
jgi:hypothetical protein